jgi:N-acetylneuraminate synthase
LANNRSPTIQLGSQVIGEGNPVYIIAEACDNHLGDVDTAIEMALRAKLAGCDAVKFQHHLPDEEMLRDTPMSSNFSEPLYDFLIRHALTIEQHERLLSYCESIGVQYLCTPFSYKAAEQLLGIGVEAFKIGSGEMTDIPSLNKMAKNLGLPMIVSTGMSTYEEIDDTYKLLTQTGIPLALMNCVSEYPPNYSDINLGVISIMANRYPDALIGHSDHTPDIYTCLAAVPLGALILEKHVILDKCQPGPDQSVSIDFHEMALLVDGVRKIENAMGSNKQVHKKEEDIRRWAFRSLVTIKPIRCGEVISPDHIWSKRPGIGIPSRHMNEFIGKKVNRDLPSDYLLQWTDLEPEEVS